VRAFGTDQINQTWLRKQTMACKGGLTVMCGAEGAPTHCTRTCTSLLAREAAFAHHCFPAKLGLVSQVRAEGALHKITLPASEKRLQRTQPSSKVRRFSHWWLKNLGGRNVSVRKLTYLCIIRATAIKRAVQFALNSDRLLRRFAAPNQAFPTPGFAEYR